MTFVAEVEKTRGGSKTETVSLETLPVLPRCFLGGRIHRYAISGFWLPFFKNMHAISRFSSYTLSYSQNRLPKCHLCIQIGFWTS